MIQNIFLILLFCLFDAKSILVSYDTQECSQEVRLIQNNMIPLNFDLFNPNLRTLTIDIWIPSEFLPTNCTFSIYNHHHNLNFWKLHLADELCTLNQNYRRASLHLEANLERKGGVLTGSFNRNDADSFLIGISKSYEFSDSDLKAEQHKFPDRNLQGGRPPPPNKNDKSPQDSSSPNQVAFIIAGIIFAGLSIGTYCIIKHLRRGTRKRSASVSNLIILGEPVQDNSAITLEQQSRPEMLSVSIYPLTEAPSLIVESQMNSPQKSVIHTPEVVKGVPVQLNRRFQIHMTSVIVDHETIDADPHTFRALGSTEQPVIASSNRLLQ